MLQSWRDVGLYQGLYTLLFVLNKETHLFSDIYVYNTSYCALIVGYNNGIPYSVKCWLGETLAKSLSSCNWKAKLWQI